MMEPMAALYRYPLLRKQIEELDERISDEYMRLETVYGVDSPELDSMPHGSQPGDPTCSSAERALPIRARIRHLEAARAWRLEAMTMVEKYLDRLDALERPIIELRYFKHMSWDDVAADQCFSRATVFRLHKTAMKKWSAG